MSLSAIMAAAASGLNASQTALRVVSDNIANVNTPGYVRKQAVQTSLVSQGMGIGVDISSIKRAANTYLQGASLLAAGDSGKAGALATGLDNAQALFGDPSGTDTFFDKLEDVWASFSAASEDPTSTLGRTQALGSVDTFLNDSSRISAGLTTLVQNTDTQLNAKTAHVNDLLKQVQSLNSDIMKGKLQGADVSGSENIQSNLLDELSGLMSVNISQRDNGGVNIRSAEGYMLAGDGAATLSYNQTNGSEGYITAQLPLGSGQPVRIGINSGELKGLLELRNVQLPGMADQLGEITSKSVDEINRSANAASSVPAPTTMTGRNTGLDAATALSGFTGKTNIVVMNSAGVIQRDVTIDFDAQTMSLDGGTTTTSFASPASFLSVLNSTNGLGSDGSASFTNGTLSLSATGSQGVAVVDDATNPSLKAGKGFSHFFGLNDVIRTSGASTYDTGLKPTDPNGFTGSITLRLMAADGTKIRDVTVTPPQPATGPPVVAGDMQDLLNSLNNTASGVGALGAFSLDADGELSFAPSNNSGVTLSVVTDTTQRGTGGPSMTQLFGIGSTERSGQASRFFVDPAVKATPSKLPFAQVNLAAGAAAAIVSGDGRGALAIAKGSDRTTKINAAGGLAAMNATIARFASEMSGSIASKAADAANRKDSADAVKTEADTQRQSVEGVSLDEELVNMTTYQQSYNASARLVSAAKEMYDTLLNMI